MVDGFLNLDVQLLAADRLADDAARLSPVGVATAAGAGLLRIAAVPFDEPRCGFQKLEVGVCDSWYGHRQPGEHEQESAKVFHGYTPAGDLPAWLPMAQSSN